MKDDLRKVKLKVNVQLNTEAMDKLIVIAKTARELADQINSFSGEYAVEVHVDKEAGHE